MNVTKEQTLAAVKTLIAVAETIREAKQVPAGTLYAMLMGVMDLPTFESMVNTLVNTRTASARPLLAARNAVSISLGLRTSRY